MSANPQPRPLVTGDLDLLISRSLDGDLPAEEERELQELLKADPSARARYDAMARVVRRLEELPELETPFAMGTRVTAQVEADTRGLAASLHRFGFYFRPATLGVVGAGIVAVTLAVTLRTPPKPAATVAAAKAPVARAQDDGRVTVYLGAAEKKDAAPAGARSNEAKGKASAEPVLVASAETAAPEERREKEEAFAPERDAPALAAAAPAAPAERSLADEQAAEGAIAQKSLAVEPARARASAPQPASVPAGPSVQLVGKGAAALRLVAPARLDGLAGPFEGSYRLELDASGRPVDVVRLFGGSGAEPAGLPERLRALRFGPADALAGGGSIDVKVRLP